MQAKSLLFLVLLPFAVQAASPTYLSPKMYPDLKAALGAPPAPMSQEQKQDEIALREFATKRSEADCKKAESMVKLDLQTAYAGSVLSQEEIKELNPLFEQVGADVDYFLVQLKAEYSRPRPYRSMKDFTTCVTKELTASYPSGHSLKLELYASMLSQIFSDRKDALQKKNAELLQIEFVSGVHYPSDVKAGKEVAKFLLTQFMKSKEFKAEVDKIKALQIQTLAR